jgi:rubrerythrin
MSEADTDIEIFEFAIAREIDANRFYLTLAQRIDNPKMRKVFEDLAKEELEHKAKLELELMKTGRVVSTRLRVGDIAASAGSPNHESAPMLSGPPPRLASGDAGAGESKNGGVGQVWQNSGPKLDMDYKDMLLLGIEKEEASFRTYVTLIGTVHEQGSREVLLAIAEEEVKHKLRFELEYDMLLKAG